MNYLFKKRYPKVLFSLIDGSLNIFSRRAPFPEKPRKILLCNLAHLGDVVISSAIFAPLKRVFPEAKFHFLSGTVSGSVLKGHPFIQKCHFLDHPKLNRTSLSKLKKFRLFGKQFFSLVQTLNKESYDFAVDLYPFYPNAIPLLWMAKIPVRMGFTSGGFGPLLTHPIAWQETRAYLAIKYKRFLEVMGISSEESLHPFLSSSSVPPLGLSSKKYFVFHMGSGNREKEWEEEKWRSFAKQCYEEGHFLVFTGKGTREWEQVERVRKGLEHTMNAVNQVDVRELIALVQHAKILMSVDSFPVHVAYGFNVPTCLLFKGSPTPYPELWLPPGDHVYVMREAEEVHTFLKACIRRNG